MFSGVREYPGYRSFGLKADPEQIHVCRSNS
jgi:hypothetical protein